MIPQFDAKLRYVNEKKNFPFMFNIKLKLSYVKFAKMEISSEYTGNSILI